VNSITKGIASAAGPYEAATGRLLTWLLLTYCLLVVCASLYPFAFAPTTAGDSVLRGLTGLLEWRTPTRRDLILNLIAYLPIGWLIAHLARRSLSAPGSALAATLGGAALSIGIELLQNWVPVRVPSLADWTLNTTSAALGAVVAQWQRNATSIAVATRLRRLHVSPALGLLIVLWLAAHAAPFMPRLRWTYIESSFDQMLRLGLDAGRLAAHFASLLVLSAVLRTLVRRETFWPLFGIVVGTSLLARLMFVGQQLTLDECLAVLMTVPLVLWLRGRGHRVAQTPLMLWICIGLVAMGTAPWQFAATPNPVVPMPFDDLLGGPGDGDSINTLQRVFLWIGAVWVGAGSRLGLRGSVALLATLSIGCEFAQTFIETRFADPTDLLLILYGALLLQAARAVDAQRSSA
jgi:VanZ family protein